MTLIINMPKWLATLFMYTDIWLKLKRPLPGEKRNAVKRNLLRHWIFFTQTGSVMHSCDLFIGWHVSKPRTSRNSKHIQQDSRKVVIGLHDYSACWSLQFDKEFVFTNFQLVLKRLNQIYQYRVLINR